MSKKDFVAFADTIRRRQHLGIDPFSDSQIVFLADFCETQNPRFNREMGKVYPGSNNLATT